MRNIHIQEAADYLRRAANAIEEADDIHNSVVRRAAVDAAEEQAYSLMDLARASLAKA